MLTYVLLPLAAPVAAFTSTVTMPVTVLLTLLALVSGTFSVRRFWALHHRHRWMYTAFIGVTFAVLLVGLGASMR